MKLTTIWTIPAMTITERVRRTIDLGAMTIAAHLPKRIRYWTFVQVGSAALLPDDVVPEVLFVDLLKRAEGGPR